MQPTESAWLESLGSTMVDFKKQLGGKKSFAKLTDPIEIYETLDRASDKGPLLPAQKAIRWGSAENNKPRTARCRIVGEYEELRVGSDQGPLSGGNEFLGIPMTGCQHR